MSYKANHITSWTSSIVYFPYALMKLAFLSSTSQPLCGPWQACAGWQVTLLTRGNWLHDICHPSASLERKKDLWASQVEVAAVEPKYLADRTSLWLDCAASRSASQRLEASPPVHTGCTPPERNHHVLGTDRICAYLQRKIQNFVKFIDASAW